MFRGPVAWTSPLTFSRAVSTSSRSATPATAASAHPGLTLVARETAACARNDLRKKLLPRLSGLQRRKSFERNARQRLYTPGESQLEPARNLDRFSFIILLWNCPSLPVKGHSREISGQRASEQSSSSQVQAYLIGRSIHFRCKERAKQIPRAFVSGTEDAMLDFRLKGMAGKYVSCTALPRPRPANARGKVRDVRKSRAREYPAGILKPLSEVSYEFPISWQSMRLRGWLLSYTSLRTKRAGA